MTHENKHREKKQFLDPKDLEMDMTPMIDVTFLLLIFFMCTLKFKTLEGRLSAYLPHDVGVNGPSAEIVDPIDVGIHVLDPGNKLSVYGGPWSPTSGERWNFDAQRRVVYSVGPRRGLDLAGLHSVLGSLNEESLAAGVVLAPGPGSVQAEAITVLDLLISRGVHEVRIQGAN